MSSAAGTVCNPLVRCGDRVEPGQPLWEVDGKRLQPSPVVGTVVQLANLPDTRAHRMLPAIFIEPAAGSIPQAFSPLAAEQVSVSALKARIAAAGVCTDHNTSDRLRRLLDPTADNRVEELVVLGIDQEPLITAFAAQLQERRTAVPKAVALMGRIAGARTVYLAVPETRAAEWKNACSSLRVEVLPIPPRYPHSLREMVIHRHGLGAETAFIGLESTLAALDAVETGTVRHQTVLSIIGPGRKPLGNFRVPLGVSLQEVMNVIGVQPGEWDKVVAGGPMRGFAQYALAGAIDSGHHGLMHIPAEEVIEWVGDPCVNCGRCLDICPARLQVQLIGRYSEFSLFERTRSFDIDQCIGCGLCATVCPSRRPLLHLIDLAKQQLPDAGTMGVKAVDRTSDRLPRLPDLAHDESVSLPDNDPAMAMFGRLPRFIVGSAPHWRMRRHLTHHHIAFILALLPAVLASAVSRFFDPAATRSDAVSGPFSDLILSLMAELGLNAGFLWFSGVIGTVLLGLGLGLLVEYLCQVMMRQPYLVVNGHGALMGLLVAMLMPPGVPIWILALALIVTIVIGKQVFGGIGYFPLHPAMVGWLVILLSWPRYIYPLGDSTIAGAHLAVVGLTLIGGLGLCAAGYIRFHIPIGVLVGVALFSILLQGRLEGGIWDQFLSGHVMLAAFFVATEPTCSPSNRLAMVLFGIGTGCLIVLIRAFGIWPDAIPFAVLLMNILNPLIDRLRPAVKKLAT